MKYKRKKLKLDRRKAAYDRFMASSASQEKKQEHRRPGSLSKRGW